MLSGGYLSVAGVVKIWNCGGGNANVGADISSHELTSKLIRVANTGVSQAIGKFSFTSYLLSISLENSSDLGVATTIRECTMVLWGGWTHLHGRFSP